MSSAAIGLNDRIETQAKTTMRDFSFSIGRSVRLRPPAARHLETLSPPPYPVRDPLRRRLEDEVEDVFKTALKRGDLASAEELLGVMESIQLRGRLRFQGERQGTPRMIERVRNALVSRKTSRRPSAG